jgi:transcriptional regulator with XRE-family HTH domain
MMPVQDTSRSLAVTSDNRDAQVVPFPRISGESRKTLRELREERGWSQEGAVRAIMACATDSERKGLPYEASLLRQWKRWEAGTVLPDGNRAVLFYQPLIARAFGTTPEQIFSPVRETRTRSVPDASDLRTEMESRRDQVQGEIGRLQDELAYLNAVLAVHVPAQSR